MKQISERLQGIDQTVDSIFHIYRFLWEKRKLYFVINI